MHRRVQAARRGRRAAGIAALRAEPPVALSFPVEFGRLHLTSATMDFIDENPELRVETSYADSFVDLIEEGVDVAVRIGNMPDSGLMARKIADNPRLLVASPAYLEKRGLPREPEDRHDHQCLSYTRYADGGDVWELGRDGEIVKVRHQARIMSDSSGAYTRRRCATMASASPPPIPASMPSTPAGWCAYCPNGGSCRSPAFTSSSPTAHISRRRCGPSSTPGQAVPPLAMEFRAPAYRHQCSWPWSLCPERRAFPRDSRSAEKHIAFKD